MLRDRAAELACPSIAEGPGTFQWHSLRGRTALGRFTLLLATDPLSDLPVAFALVAANDQYHMLRFLRNLKNWGL